MCFQLVTRRITFFILRTRSWRRKAQLSLILSVCLFGADVSVKKCPIKITNISIGFTPRRKVQLTLCLLELNFRNLYVESKWQTCRLLRWVMHQVALWDVYDPVFLELETERLKPEYPSCFNSDLFWSRDLLCNTDGATVWCCFTMTCFCSHWRCWCTQSKSKLICLLDALENLSTFNQVYSLYLYQIKQAN